MPAPKKRPPKGVTPPQLLAAGTVWKPGQSGNPLGRPLGVAALARKYTEDGRIPFEFLVGLVRKESASDRDRREASAILLAYAYGTPMSTSVQLQLDATHGPSGAALALPDGALESLLRAFDAPPARPALDAPTFTHTVDVAPLEPAATPTPTYTEVEAVGCAVGCMKPFPASEAPDLPTPTPAPDTLTQ